MTGLLWTRPWALAFLGGAVAAAALYAALFRWKARAAARLGDPALLAALADPQAPRRQRIKAVLASAAAALLAFALAGPRGGRQYREVHRKGVDVVIAVDVSASMLAEDVKPSRLVQAKRELGLLIDGLDGDRVAVAAFAGAAVLQCPLTLDYAAARSILDLVGPDLIPVPGTNLAAALDAALDAFPQGARKYKAVVLLTDGEDHSGRLAKSVKRAADEGARVFAIGLGNPAGEVIPVRDEAGRVVDYKKDRAGKTVVSKLGEEGLRDMAAKTGGAYHRASADEGEVERLLRDIRGMEKKNLEDRRYDRTRDRYRWPLGLALLLLFMEFFWPERKVPGFRLPGRSLSKAAAAALLFLLISPTWAAGRKPSEARYLKAAEEWERRAGKAPQDAEAASNLGQALYRGGQPEKAAEAFARAEALDKDPARRMEAAYNAGNALARSNKGAEALEKYKTAMRLNPDDLDAKRNYELVKKMMKEGGKGGSGKPSPKDKKDQKGEPAPGDKKDGQGEKEKGPAPGSLSKEDAERILQAVEDQEKEARRKAKVPAAGKTPSEEDW